jgi:hypothetical protein
VSFKRWLRVGWLVLIADVVYWIWQMGQVNAVGGLPTWHVVLNIVTVIGGCVLFAVLLLSSYVGWRGKQSEV